MKRHVLVAIILGLAVMVVSAAPAMAGWAGVTQCYIGAAVSMIEAAQRLQPEDKFIGMFLSEMRNYEAGRASENMGK